jgi:ribose transport system ATP-binding protein/rhamnose transport system ATP-binding protein
MRDLAARGHALIFVSHRMEEIFTVTDRVSVMREGRTVAKALPTNSLDIGKLVELMVGQAVSDIYSRATAPTTRSDGAVALRVSHLACPPMVRDVSFQVRHGEIVALAGLVGAGRSETVETIFGLRRPTGGSIELEGKPFQANWPVQAIRAGIGLIPEDRRRQGIVPDFSVRENLLLAHLGNHDGFGLAYDQHRGHILALLELLGLPSDRLLDASLLNFSGGMQQKIIVARWLLLNPKVLLLDEPTRGVDIGTRSSIYALLRRIAAQGVAVVVVSSDFEEVIGLADRIVVMSDGVSVSEQPSELLTVGSLTMFAAPRSSAQRTHATLESLVRAYGGVAAWIEQEGERVFCFDRAGDDAAADPGFAAGSIHDAAKLVIAPALRERAGGFVACEGGRGVLLVPIIGRRGHELGLVCLSLSPGTVPPAAEAAASMVTARLSVQKTQVMTGEAA